MRLHSRRAVLRRPVPGRPERPEVPDAAWRAVMAAFGRHLGLSLSEERARAWAAAGWRPEDAAAVTGLSARAVADRTALGRAYRSDARGLATRLGEVVVAWFIHCALSPAEVLGWLGVLAAAPTVELARELEDLLESGRASRRATASGAAELDPWRSLPLPLATLAWAAGISAGEAAAHDPDGAPELRVLAALRGFRLPG